MLSLQQSAAGLPDARSRLDFIVRKTGEAVDKVFIAVEHVKQEQVAIRDGLLMTSLTQSRRSKKKGRTPCRGSGRVGLNGDLTSIR